MTESEWLSTAHPALMLSYLGERASRRKLTLFGCAAVRRVWHLLTHKHGRRAVVATEQYADGIPMSRAVVDAANRAREQIQYASKTGQHALKAVCRVADASRQPEIGSVIADAVSNLRFIDPISETVAQGDLLRDIFGNPFDPVTVDPRWQSAAAVSLAVGIYEQCAFDRLPILADALEEAGCDDADILNHCRSPSPHVKGCWVVDLVLGKE